MFTGIIADLGLVKQISRRAGEADLEISAGFSLQDVGRGDSIAVNGVCLTVTGKKGQVFAVYVSLETLEKTNIKWLRGGDRVNLEKPLRLADFVGGHLVLGHVDGLGKIMEKKENADSLRFGFEAPDGLSRYIVEKGSIAIDGVSLTVNQCMRNIFYVNVIPHTAKNTTLGLRKPGEAVNLETDIIGKYVEKLLVGKGGIDRDFLKKYGFIK